MQNYSSNEHHSVRSRTAPGEDTSTSDSSDKSEALEDSQLSLTRDRSMENIGLKQQIANAFRNRNLVVDLIVLFFASGAWVGVTGTYLQVPLIVSNAPEGWNLPSYMVVIVQLGNVGPMLYTGLQKIRAFRDANMIFIVKLIGAVSSLLMAFFYNKTAYIFGAERSVALFVLLFFFANVACTSAVLFMPYMGRFRDIYLTTFLIGEGLSGFITGVVSLIQGVGGNTECILNNSTDPNAPEYIPYIPEPLFGPKEFYFFIFSMFLVSFIAFTILDNHKMCKREYAGVTIGNGNHYVYDIQNESEKNAKIITTRSYKLLMCLMATVCFFGNGLFPSIQSFSCLPYGNVAYHLTVTLSSMSSPVACFLAMFLPHTSIKTTTILSGVSGLIAIYLFTTAIMSPPPPLVGTTLGNVLLISSWTIFMGILGYVRLSITSIFRYQGGRSLVYVGVVGQIATVIASISTFCVVNFTNVFVSYKPC